MKILIGFLLSAASLLGQCAANSPIFTTAGDLSTTIDNRTKACYSWVFTYNSTGFSALSIQVEAAPDVAGVPGTWAAIVAPALVTGSNPSTTTTYNAMTLQTNPPWVRVKLVSKTGTGSIKYQLTGTAGAQPVQVGAGSAGGAAGGDLCGMYPDPTVCKVNGAAVPASATVAGTNASRQIIAAALTNGSFWLGNGSNLPIAVALSGDCTMTNAAVITCTQINGAVVPLSAPVVASNASRQLIAATTNGTGSTVLLQGSPTITTPTIASFANSNHTHADAAGGGQVTEAALNLSNNTTANVSTSAHGFIPILPNDSTKFFNGAGTYSVPGGGSGGGGVVTYSGPALSTLTGTIFCPVGGGASCSATETNVDIDSSAAATVANLYVQLSAALGVGNSVVVTWRKNASSQTSTCTISGNSATSCNDTTHSFNVATGDLLSYQLAFSGTIVITPTITIMSAFGTSNVGVTGVAGTAPVVSSGGTTPTISCATCVTGTPTNHGVMLGSATQAASYSGAGTLGQVFASGGASADGAYQNGGMVLLEQHTASGGSSINFTTCISSLYDDYQIQLINITPATNAVALWLRVSTDGGGTFQASNYLTATWVVNSAAGSAADTGTSAAQASLTGVNVSSTAGRGLGGSFTLVDPLNTSQTKTSTSKVSYLGSDGTLRSHTGAVMWNATTAVNAFQVLMSSGNISGTARCYGFFH